MRATLFDSAYEDPKAETKLANATQLYTDGKYDKAREIFRDLADNQSNPTDLAEQARFMQAECRYQRGQFPEAVDTYHKLLMDFPTGAHRRECCQHMYEIADYWLDDFRAELERRRTKTACCAGGRVAEPVGPHEAVPRSGRAHARSAQQHLGPGHDRPERGQGDLLVRVRELRARQLPGSRPLLQPDGRASQGQPAAPAGDGVSRFRRRTTRPAARTTTAASAPRHCNWSTWPRPACRS